MKKKTTAARRPARKRGQKKTGSKYEITGIILFFCGLFILVSLFVGNTGFLGDLVDKGTHFLFGLLAPLMALLMMYFGGKYAVTGRGVSFTRRGALVILLTALVLAFLHHVMVPMGKELEVTNLLSYGGIVGAAISTLLHRALGELGTTLCLLCLIVVDVLLLTHWSFSAGAQKVGGKAQKMGKKTGQKVEDVAERLRAKKAAMDAARSAARLEPIGDEPGDFVYKKSEDAENGEQDIPPAPPLPEDDEEEYMPASMPEGNPVPPEEEYPEPEPAAEPDFVSEEQEQPVPTMDEPTPTDGGGEDQNREILTPEDSAPEELDETETMAPEPEEQELEEEKPDVSNSGGLTDAEATDTPMPQQDEEPNHISNENDGTLQTENGNTSNLTPNLIDDGGIPGGRVPAAAAIHMPTESIVRPVYHFPPLTLLHSGGQVTGQMDVAKKASLIETTLNSFGVHAKVVHSSVGPTVTRFELKPEMGVRVSKIEGLSNELAMALEATTIRIEAPIPGKSAVGIEIPNTKAAPVPLRDVLESPEFQKGKGHILVALGKGITGRPVVTDISKAPHLLIAGSTGSGKSVCINSIITSIIYKYRPDEVKLMLIDPKVVELSVYNGIPHLRTEVVTDMKKAQGTLNWAVREMEARYQLFAGAKVRNIEGYNEANPDKKMPYILIIVDEFADLMNVAAKEVEVLIQRLTQKARAAGIHLILATQRPSANVITGVIKSNIPSRISFMVESNLNSRIILDEGGAEKLLGKGDMLFKQAGALHTVRVQGAFISDQEVEAVVDYVKDECMKQEKQPVTYEPIDLSVPEDKKEDAPEEEEETDELLPEAAEWVLDTKRASVSALQRRFRIGYTRAGRLMDTMERMGIVGPAEGAKPRDILMTKEQLAEKLSGNHEETA